MEPEEESDSVSEARGGQQNQGERHFSYYGRRPGAGASQPHPGLRSGIAMEERAPEFVTDDGDARAAGTTGAPSLGIIAAGEGNGRTAGVIRGDGLEDTGKARSRTSESTPLADFPPRIR